MVHNFRISAGDIKHVRKHADKEMQIPTYGARGDEALFWWDGETNSLAISVDTANERSESDGHGEILLMDRGLAALNAGQSILCLTTSGVVMVVPPTPQAAPETSPIESGDAAEHSPLEQQRKALWRAMGMAPPTIVDITAATLDDGEMIQPEAIMRGTREPVTGKGRVSYQVDLSFETIDMLRRERHGLVSMLDTGYHATVQCVDGADVLRITVRPGRTEWESFSLGKGGEIQPVRTFKPTMAVDDSSFAPDVSETLYDRDAFAMDQRLGDSDAVRSSEFGVAPQVGKMLLDGLKAIRRIKWGQAGPDRLSDMLREIDRLIAEAEKPGLPVPPAAATGTPWRLPTLDECDGDPEATRVWNAVHKPALEWQETATVGSPPFNSACSARRPIWYHYGPTGPGPLFVTASGFREIAGEVPAYWCEVEPAPPLPSESPKPELTARIDYGL